MRENFIIHILSALRSSLCNATLALFYIRNYAISAHRFTREYAKELPHYFVDMLPSR